MEPWMKKMVAARARLENALEMYEDPRADECSQQYRVQSEDEVVVAIWRLIEAMDEAVPYEARALMHRMRGGGPPGPPGPAGARGVAGEAGPPGRP